MGNPYNRVVTKDEKLLDGNTTRTKVSSKNKIKELKKSRDFWRAKAIQLEKYIDEHCIDDSFENL